MLHVCPAGDKIPKTGLRQASSKCDMKIVDSISPSSCNSLCHSLMRKSESWRTVKRQCGDEMSGEIICLPKRACVWARQLIMPVLSSDSEYIICHLPRTLAHPLIMHSAQTLELHYTLTASHLRRRVTTLLPRLEMRVKTNSD